MSLFEDSGVGVMWIPCKVVSLRECEPKEAAYYVSVWHSVLPKCPTFLVRGTCYMAHGDDGFPVAVAVWSDPIARMLNGKGYYELRRLATAPECPKNACTAMLAAMRKHIASIRPDVKTFLSYQDQVAHFGTIYKADNWSPAWESKRATSGKNNWSNSRDNRGDIQSSAPKTAWVRAA